MNGFALNNVVIWEIVRRAIVGFDFFWVSGGCESCRVKLRRVKLQVPGIVYYLVNYSAGRVKEFYKYTDSLEIKAKNFVPIWESNRKLVN